MCGLVGLINPGMPKERANAILVKMMDIISHRGPDGEGISCFEPPGVYLGHRRLAIIDPKHGIQPMTTKDDRVTIVFNGVIYNYMELRRELITKGHPIHTYSDTEVLLYAYREWGDQCVERLIGMFAFAIWDKEKSRLFCARDRIGIKPFYYYFDGEVLTFASEIKAILVTGIVKPEVDTCGLLDYLTFQFCLNERTLFKDIRKLEPGHCLIVQMNGGRPSITIRRYWDVNYDIDDTHDEQWFVDHLSSLISDTVRIHLRSDVALGAHLSGGIDSSSVVCLMAEHLKGERIKTFTGAFPEGPGFDETAYAKVVADFAGTEYHERYIDGAELPQVLPKLIYFMDEPMAGPGLIPQYYVSELASQHVKVVLGGQGGDELFLGYMRYLVAYLEESLSGAIFETAHKQSYAVTLESIIPNLPLLQLYAPMLRGFWRDGLFGTQDRRYFRLIDRSEGMSHLFTADLFNNNYLPYESFHEIFNRQDLHSLINRMTYFDLKGSLPALLHVEDRTSMAASIESRVPLLDHRLVEFMAHIPPNIKFAGGRTKHLFREAMRNRVPGQILDRKDKMGFPTPVTQWAKGVAKDFVRDMILSERVKKRGIYNLQAVEKAIQDEHEFGRVIWGLLCLELWFRIFIDGDMNVVA